MVAMNLSKKHLSREDSDMVNIAGKEDGKIDRLTAD
ncbi:hypothetical protein Tco_0579848, partial [Tanacetum coccineum]